jgi:hypothetical protein
MANNEDIVTFNASQIAKNTELIASGCGVDKATSPPDLCPHSSPYPSLQATAESNAALIASNSQRIAAITAQASENAAKCTGILASTEANRESIVANAATIQERRARMRSNQEHIHENQDKISELITAVQVCCWARLRVILVDLTRGRAQASASSASGQVAANKVQYVTSLQSHPLSFAFLQSSFPHSSPLFPSSTRLPLLPIVSRCTPLRALFWRTKHARSSPCKWQKI